MRKQVWLKFILPLMVSLLIVLTMILSINGRDEEGMVNSYSKTGQVIVFGLFAINILLFFVNLIIRYKRKMNNYLINFFFLFYAGFSFATIIQDDLSTSISSLAFYSALFMAVIVINLLLYLFLRNKVISVKVMKNDDQALKGKLPFVWYSSRDHLLVTVSIFIAFILLILGFVFELKFYYYFLIVILFIITQSYLSFKQQFYLNKILRVYFDNLDINNLKNNLRQLKTDKLHPMTISKLNLIEIDILLYNDFELAEGLLNNINLEDQYIDIDTYRLTIIDYHFLKENYKEAIKLIDDLINKNKNIHFEKMLINYKERIEMIVNKTPNPTLLEVLQTNTISRYHNLLNSLVYAEYYYYNGDNENALKSLNALSKCELLTIRDRANHLLKSLNV